MNLLRQLRLMAARLRKARCSQPFCTSEEAYAQMERMKALKRVKSQVISGGY